MYGCCCCCGGENLEAKRKTATTTSTLHVMQTFLIIKLSCWSPNPGMSMFLHLVSISSFSRGTLHCSSGVGAQYTNVLATLEVRESLLTLQSLAILERVLPVRVLLSSMTRLARYLTLLLLQELIPSRNLTRRLQSMVLG